jgi:hypothetical protein
MIGWPAAERLDRRRHGGPPDVRQRVHEVDDDTETAAR